MVNPRAENMSLAEFLIWEEQQDERHEWIDGIVVRWADGSILSPCGGNDNHGVIISNLTAAFHGAVRNGSCVVLGSDRQIVPLDDTGNDLGSFYADLFVSCAASDRAGSAAHFPTVVVEVLSDQTGEEFTSKMRAYTQSAQSEDYLIIESSRQFVHQYSWRADTHGVRRLMWRHQQRGLVCVPCLGLTLTFEQIYEKCSARGNAHRMGGDEDGA